MKKLFILLVSIAFVFPVLKMHAQPYMLKEGQTAVTIKDGKISFNNGSQSKQNVNKKSKSISKQKTVKGIKLKKYPSRRDIDEKSELYPEFGSYEVVEGEFSKYYLWENGARQYFNGSEILYPDGTLRKWNGGIFLADGTNLTYKGEIIRLDGTQVDEYGTPIKGAPKITPTIYGEGNKTPEEVLGLPKKKSK